MTDITLECKLCGTPFVLPPKRQYTGTGTKKMQQCCSKKCAQRYRFVNVNRPGYKKCKACSVWKSLRAYSKSTTKNTHETTCKKCCAARAQFLWNERSGDSRQLLRTLARTTKVRARKKGWNHNLTEESLMEKLKLQKGLCYISRVPMTFFRGKGRVPTNVSVDRIDSLGGYTNDNVALACDAINVMKSYLPMKDFVHFCEKVVQYAKKV